jgi:hypothetical protein
MLHTTAPTTAAAMHISTMIVGKFMKIDEDDDDDEDGNGNGNGDGNDDEDDDEEEEEDGI